MYLLPKAGHGAMGFFDGYPGMNIRYVGEHADQSHLKSVGKRIVTQGIIFFWQACSLFQVSLSPLSVPNYP
jgi:hypothetical protein